MSDQALAGKFHQQNPLIVNCNYSFKWKCRREYADRGKDWNYVHLAHCLTHCNTRRYFTVKTHDNSLL